MKIPYQEFDPLRFSFHEHPIVALQNFWSEEEMAGFRRAMQSSKWSRLSEMPGLQQRFPHCGDWSMAEIGHAERAAFLDRVLMPCVEEYMHSFEHVKGGTMNFHYFDYGVGDSLSIHDDDVREKHQPLVRRRIAATTYMHDEWDAHWGGEFMAYRRIERDGEPTYELTHCFEPERGQLVLFTVPRYHRVTRIDPLAGNHRRLSISGWFMTEHWREPE